MKNKYIKHYANIAPKKGYINIIEQISEANNPRFKKVIRTRIIKQIPITIDIPSIEYEKEVSRFDNTAIQSDDRLYTTTQKYKAYDKIICAKLCEEALKGFNTEHILLKGE